MKITFSKTAKRFILDALGYTVDKQGFIKDSSEHRVVTRLGKKVKLKNFAGVQKDFGLVTDDFECIVALSDFLKEKE